jgi:cyclophilin family peptidyl-prolyl cis-trans isomerase/HEAT repeat protein
MRGPRSSRTLLLLAAGALAFVSCRPPAVSSELEVSDEETAEDAASRIDRAEDTRTFSEDLASLADDGDYIVRGRLATALGRIGDPRAVPTLLRLMSDREVQVREDAVFAVGLVGEGAGRDAVDALVSALEPGSDREIPEAAILDALGRTATGAELPRVSKRLDSPDAAIRAAAARALGLLGQRKIAPDAAAVDGLAVALSDGDEAVRFMAAFALFRGGFGASPAAAKVALASAARSDPSFEVRALAIRALAKGGALDDDALDAAMRDGDDRVAATAMMSLEALEKPRRCARSAKALEISAARIETDAKCLSSTCAHAVRAALEGSLDCAASPEVARIAGRIESLTGGVKEEPSAGAARIRCLARFLAGEDDLALVACDPKRPYTGKRLLVRRLASREQKSDDDVAALVAFAAEPDLRVAATALEALAAIPNDAARGAVLGALESLRLNVVGAALDAITAAPDGFLGGKVVSRIAAVVERFKSSKEGHAPLVSAASALAALGGEESAAVLAILAADARPEVRNAAREALAQIPGTAFPGTLPPLQPPRPASHLPRAAWVGEHIDAAVRTTRGDFTMELHPALAPATVESFVELARRGFFDGTEIHRVVPNFVVQAGDPTGSGLADAGYALRCEITDTPYVRGTVGMALSGKDTGGSQFFVALSRQPHLDGRYTVFGEVVSGMEILDAIEEGDAILGVEITEVDAGRQGN